MVKNVRMEPAPSIMAASSISEGIDLITPVKMNTGNPAPNPRYTSHMPHGVLRSNVSVSLLRGNMTIWKGTTMLAINARYISLATQLLTLTIHHAHMEQHSRISATDPSVSMIVHPKLGRIFVFSMPRS